MYLDLQPQSRVNRAKQFCRPPLATIRPTPGQAAIETLAIMLTVGLLLGGVNWMRGESGLIAFLVEALRVWHARFGSALSLPM